MKYLLYSKPNYFHKQVNYALHITHHLKNIQNTTVLKLKMTL